MHIRILGAHHNESKNTRFVCLLIDDVLALDAGALTSSLSLEEQHQLKAVLVTHCHFDHIRDLPALAANVYMSGSQIDLGSTVGTYNNIKSHVFNNVLYPDYFEIPTGKPALVFQQVNPGVKGFVGGYEVLPVSVNHSACSVGYLVCNNQGQKLLFTGDTGPGIGSLWQQLSPQVIITEITFSNRFESSAASMGHLVPSLLSRELEDFKACKGSLPRLIMLHMNSAVETEIKEETNLISRKLGVPIILATEGMEIDLLEGI